MSMSAEQLDTCTVGTTVAYLGGAAHRQYDGADPVWATTQGALVTSEHLAGLVGVRIVDAPAPDDAVSRADQCLNGLRAMDVREAMDIDPDWLLAAIQTVSTGWTVLRQGDYVRSIGDSR